MSAPLRLLFVCSGNICRSPMAAVLAEEEAMQRSVECEVRSASTLGLNNRHAHPKADRVMLEIGLTTRDHRSTPLSDELLGWATHVFIMDSSHLLALRDYEVQPKRVVQMGPLAGVGEIDDPVDSWFLFMFRRVRDELRVGVKRFFDGVGA